MFIKKFNNARDYQRQKAWLSFYQDRGAVKLLEHDDFKHTLILEYVSDHSLKNLFPDEENHSIEIACETIQSLHQNPIKPSTDFPHLQDWCACLNQEQDLAQELLSTTLKEILLHGDLHHGNILLRGDEAIVIDPKPVIGDPFFEPARFILNPIDCILDQRHVKDILENRILKFETFFGDTTHRIRRWTYVCALISARWNIDDGFSPEKWDTLAELIRNFL